MLRDFVSSVCDCGRLGTKFRPKARTSSCVGSSVLDERLVMYFDLSILCLVYLILHLFVGFFSVGIVLWGRIVGWEVKNVGIIGI